MSLPVTDEFPRPKTVGEADHAIMKPPPFWAAFEEPHSAEMPAPDSLGSTKTITATREEDDQDDSVLDPSDFRPRVLHTLTQTLTKMREEQDQDAPLAPAGAVPRSAHVATQTITEMREEVDQDQPLRHLLALPRTGTP